MSQLEAEDRALADYNPFDPVLMQDPWRYYQKLREEAPVYRDPHTGMAVSYKNLTLPTNREV